MDDMETQEDNSISQPVEKRSVSRLPTLTKVAAWWLLVVGIVGVTGAIVISILLGSSVGDGDPAEWGVAAAMYVMVFLGVVCPVFILVTIGGGLLFTRRKGAWIFCVVVISILVFGSIISRAVYYYEYILLIPVALLLIPLILLLSDAGNYWNMARAVKTARTVRTRSKGFAIASVVCGVIGAFLYCIWGIEIIVCLLGLVFGIMVLSRTRGVVSTGYKVMAITGIVLSSVGLIWSVYWLVWVWFR